jgi:CheY-like chemotaxis protein
MEPQNSTRELTALVVDDDRVIRMILRRLLEKAGVKNVEEVKNGQEAVEVHRSGKHFDLILMDKHMSVMNGVEATKKLRSMNIDSMIVGVSSCETEAEQKEFMDAGLNDLKQKPLSIDVVSSILDVVKASM